MNENRFEPQDFIKDLKRIKPFKDNRVLILYCNLYIEHYVKLLYKKHKNDPKIEECSMCKRKLTPSFMDKVKELSDVGLVDTNNKHQDLIIMVNKNRNIAGHELNFIETKIIEGITKTLSESQKVDPYGILEKVLKKITPWENLEISAVAVVTKLYQKNEEINGRKLQNRLIFMINEKHTKIFPKIVSIDDKRY